METSTGEATLAPAEAPLAPAEAPLAPADERDDAWIITGLGPALRDIARAALAGLLAGGLVLGIGGRLVMRAATLLDPSATGRFTENGARIGDITIEGSLAVFVFSGLLTGAAASVVWIAVVPWLPSTGLRRGFLAAPIAVALSGFLLIEGDNSDFRVLDATVPILALLLALIAVFAITLSVVDTRLDRRLQRVTSAGSRALIAYGILTLTGAVLIVPLSIGFYFSADVCGCRPERSVGAAIAVAGGATVAWWVARAQGAVEPPRVLVLVGRIAIAVGAAIGALRVIEEIRFITLV